MIALITLMCLAGAVEGGSCQKAAAILTLGPDVEAGLKAKIENELGDSLGEKDFITKMTVSPDGEDVTFDLLKVEKDGIEFHYKMEGDQLSLSSKGTFDEFDTCDLKSF
ncbi:unnamed protein product [Heligmosomoides polygyrus]|uniref:Lipocln_cytosolic_FA-bd_dom domain-containing protein n=1 Tax=Heligmosomoides polygyrus TaxID=6339 RepID=A0A183FWN1_HELPZ|nr:unnamed protein product [Heligmosomoides polygyrus]